MAVTTAAVVGMAGSAMGAYSSYRGARAQDRAANAAMNAASQGTSLSPIQIGTSVGGGYSAGTGGQGGFLDFGGNSGLYNNFGNFAGSAMNSAMSQGGIPGNVGAANASLQSLVNNNRFMNAFEPAQGQLSGQLGQAFSRANDMYMGLAQQGQPSMMNLQNTAFTGAAQQAALASQGFNDVRDSTLATLRQQAQPFEQRQFQGLQNNLFATGRLGTSGGGLQTEAFARGLGQADLSRQLEATNQARLTQQQALSQAQGLSGIGSNILNDAFNRFGQTQGMFDNSLQQRFANSALVNQTQFNQQQQNFGNQLQLAGLPAALQGAQLNNALLGLQGQQGIQGMGLNIANLGLAQSQADTNARLGQQSNLVAAASNPNLGARNDMLGQIFSGIGSRVGGNQSATDLLGRMFGNYSFDNIGGGNLANSALADAGFGG